MTVRTEWKTSASLLLKLRQNPNDQEAWDDFVDRYGRMIFRWCRQWGLQEADAQDVTQNVLLELAHQMRRFVYDSSGSFRGWLKTIAYRGWCHLLSSRQRAGVGSGNETVLQLLQSVEARDDFLGRIEAESDRELLDRAIAHVQLRVQPRTWEAFRLTAIEEMPGAEVAERLRMKLGTVYVARSKVQKMLQEEVHRLNNRSTN